MTERELLELTARMRDQQRRAELIERQHQARLAMLQSVTAMLFAQLTAPWNALAWYLRITAQQQSEKPSV